MLGVTPLEAGCTPADALRRVGFLLERSRAGTFRVQAFRKAADIVRGMPDGEVSARAAAGTLGELPGLGPATAAVVTEATRGELPAYLTSLQERAEGTLAAGGEAMYAAVVGDLHSHSDWSDGGSPIDEMVLSAVELGQDWMALTDHSPRLKVANGLSVARLTQQLGVVDAVNASLGGRFRLLRGIEVDILDDGSLDQTPEMLARLDVVTASVHSKLAMDSAPMTRRMVAAVRNPRVNVLGHCTGRLVEGAGHAQAVPVRRAGGVRGVRGERRRRRDQLAAGAARPRTSSSSWRSRSAASSRWTPTPMLRGSWTSRRTGASGRSGSAYRPSGSSRRGP